MHMRSIPCMAPTSSFKTHTISTHSNAVITASAILCELHIHRIVISMLFHPCIMYHGPWIAKYISHITLCTYNQGINMYSAHDYNHISRTYHHHQQMAQNLVLQFFSISLSPDSPFRFRFSVFLSVGLLLL